MPVSAIQGVCHTWFQFRWPTARSRNLPRSKVRWGYRVTSLAHDPATQTLFYTTDNLGYRNLMAYDIKSGKSRTLFEAARIGDLAFNAADRSLWGLRTNNGFAMLVRIAYPYTEWKSVHVFPFGEVPFDVDVSADGKNLSSSLAGPDEPCRACRPCNCAS